MRVKAAIICISIFSLATSVFGGDNPPARTNLPKFFNQLDLTDQQKAKITAIMDECDEKVEKHKSEIKRLQGKHFVTSVIIAHANAIKKLQAMRMEAVEKVLTDDQRAKLKELRDGK
jgi:Spy/CpxP family protein refolding chaperone